MTSSLRVAALLLFAAMLAPFAAARDAESFDKREFTCPLGGKNFTQDVGYSSFPLITLPDGSWLGDTEIGVQIPVCPDNGLVLLPDLGKSSAEGESDRILYGEYSAAEIERLPALIADPDYRALAAQGRYAQAYWLASKMGRPAEDRFFMLQRATWATRDPALRKTLVARFVADAPGVIDGLRGGETAKRFARVYVVNGLRELGRFDEALALLDSIAAGGPPVPGQDDPDSIFGPGDADGPLRLAIQQRDDGRFAAATVPDRLLSDICDGKLAVIYGPTTEPTKAACKVRRDAATKDSDDFEAAMRLRDDPAALDTRCAATPPDERDGALTKACDYAQDDRDQAAGEDMTQDGARLSADCDATPDDKRSGALSHGCVSLDIATQSALGKQLADDPAAYAIFCPGRRGGDIADRSEMADRGCMNADWALKAREEAALVADPGRLDGYCSAKDKEGYTQSRADIDYEVLLSACSTLERNRRDAEIDRLATESAAFDAQCGGYRKTNSAGNEVYGLTEAQERCRRAWRLRENRRVQADADAKGLKCFGDVIYSPERPRCVSAARYEEEMAGDTLPAGRAAAPNLSKFDEGSSLMQVARVRAAAIVARGKSEGHYPKRQPGDLD